MLKTRTGIYSDDQDDFKLISLLINIFQAGIVFFFTMISAGILGQKLGEVNKESILNVC